MFFSAIGKVHFLIRTFFAFAVILAAVVLFIAALAVGSASAGAALCEAGCFCASGYSWWSAISLSITLFTASGVM